MFASLGKIFGRANLGSGAASNAGFARSSDSNFKSQGLGASGSRRTGLYSPALAWLPEPPWRLGH